MADPPTDTGRPSDRFEFVAPDTLSFDLMNPRFADLPRENEEDILRYLAERSDLNEILRSIATTGYQQIEPLLVWTDPDARRDIVLEGNRRLAAVRLLRNHQLAAQLGIDLPIVSAELLRTTDLLLIKRVQGRAEARAFIGFKHVNGPNKWDAHAKAKFAADWIQEDPTISITRIAQSFGDTHNTVRRLVLGWFALAQAEVNGFGRETAATRRFFFSHLYTALARPAYRTFLGLSDDFDTIPLRANPIPTENMPQFRQLMSWLYGDKENRLAPIVVHQNPDLNRLADVLANKAAHRVLSATRDLDVAYRELVPVAREFENALIEAVQRAQGAASLVSAFNGDETLLEMADRLARTTTALLRTMRTIAEEQPTPAERTH